MDILLTTVYEQFLEDESYPYNIHMYFDKIDNVSCNSRFDMRSDNMIKFLIYSKNVYCKYDDNDPIILYLKVYTVSKKELAEKKLNKNKFKKFTDGLFEDVPKLCLSTMGSLEIKEEAEVLDKMNDLFIGMPNITYSAQKCHKCENKTTTKVPCCKTHLCYRCWFDCVECPTCEKDISYV
jgi:hypothetical protein